MLNLTHLEFVKTNKMADLLFLLIDPQIREESSNSEKLTSTN